MKRFTLQTRDFTTEGFLHFDTADRRIFLEPYGPEYPKAVGKIIKWERDTEANLGFIKKILPELPEERTFLIRVKQQIILENGNPLLIAEIQPQDRISDDYNDPYNPTKIVNIELFKESAQTY